MQHGSLQPLGDAYGDEGEDGNRCELQCRLREIQLQRAQSVAERQAQPVNLQGHQHCDERNAARLQDSDGQVVGITAEHCGGEREGSSRHGIGREQVVHHGPLTQAVVKHVPVQQQPHNDARRQPQAPTRRKGGNADLRRDPGERRQEQRDGQRQPLRRATAWRSQAA